MSAPLMIEPARYGRTGLVIGLQGIRPEFHTEALTYALDAPAFIPVGSTRGAFVPERPQGYHYISATELRA